MRFARCLAAFAALVCMVWAAPSPRICAQARPIDVDDAADEERLNRELWETIKGLPYSVAREHAARRQREAPAAAATATLPTGWRIAPLGRQIPVGRLPYVAVEFAGSLIVLNNGYYTGPAKPEVSVVDLSTGAIVRTLLFDSLFPSVVTSGDDLFISGGISGKVFRLNRQFETVQTYSVSGYAGPIAIVDGSHIAVGSLVAGTTQSEFDRGAYQQGRIAIVNTASGVSERETTSGYFPYGLCHSHGKLYASLLGDNAVQVLDDTLREIKTLRVGSAPQQIVEASDDLYVVNANSDSLSIIDATRDIVRETLHVGGKGSRFGAAPSSVAVDGDRIYVSLANLNAIGVWDRRSHRPLGSVRTGWYPTFVHAGRSGLIYLSAKGVLPRRPNPNGPQPIAEPPPPAPLHNGPDYVLTLLHGTVGTVPLSELDSALRAGARNRAEPLSAGAPLFDAGSGLQVPIKHIFYIVRENRTYDQVMGDLQRANGDPFLTLFGREITPNGHRLAESFVTLDNYYADGEISVLGHSFTTSGYASPFLEWLGNATYSGRYKSYPFGTVPGVTSPSYLWDALDARRVDYRIYGENYYLYTRAYRILSGVLGPESALAKRFQARTMELATVSDRGNLFYNFAHDYYGRAKNVGDARRLIADPTFAGGLSRFLVGDASLAETLEGNSELRNQFAQYLVRYPFNYRSWDLAFSDLDRFQAWKADFDYQVKSGRVARLHYIWLPNDHTAGGSTVPLPPDQLVAQNDAALGKIVETISHSPIWKESLILVTEDDAQNGPDHVDATRTVCLAIGPYVKRNQVISDRYDQLSLLRTIELLLGLSPLNRTDALAAPMLGIFTDTPDFTLFEHPELSTHLSDADRQRARR